MPNSVATDGTVAHQPPLPMEFSRQEFWSRLPFLSPGDIPNPGIKLRSPALQADSLPLSHQGSPKIWFTITFSEHLIYSHVGNHWKNIEEPATLQREPQLSKWGFVFQSLKSENHV